MHKFQSVVKLFRIAHQLTQNYQKNRTSERFLGTLLGPLLKTKFALRKNELKPLAESVLIPLGLSAGTSNFK